MPTTQDINSARTVRTQECASAALVSVAQFLEKDEDAFPPPAAESSSSQISFGDRKYISGGADAATMKDSVSVHLT